MRGDAGEHQDKIDNSFGRMFNKIVVKVDPDELNFEELVDLFEEVENAMGGELRDEENRERLTYGTRIRIDVQHGRISVSGGGRQQVCSELLARVRQYRFGLGGPSHLLLA